MDHFIGDFDPARRRNAVANMASQLAVVAELGGLGAMTPASWGMFSNRLPRFGPPPRTASRSRSLKVPMPVPPMLPWVACTKRWSFSTSPKFQPSP